MPTTRIAAFLLAALCPVCAHAANPAARFDSVDSFISSMPGATHENVKGAYGELSGPGHKDWAGLVFINNPDSEGTQQIFILTQGDDGKYQLAASDQSSDADGGTGHHTVDEVKIAKSSVYISSSWNWHGCGGGATHQFKNYNGQWRLIGVTFNRSNSTTTNVKGEAAYDVGDSVNIDRNVLTGNIIIKSKPLGKKPVTENIHVAPELLLFNDYQDELGWIDRFNGYANC